MHEWKSSKNDREHWTSVKVQTFFASSGFERYFTVHAREEEATSRAHNNDDNEFIQAMLNK